MRARPRRSAVNEPPFTAVHCLLYEFITVRAAARGSGGVMSLVRLLGFTTLSCGCVVGRYREVATSREVAYVEEKGNSCAAHGHRRNHTVTPDRLLLAQPALAMSRTA
jgi:hypothetical protein